MTALIRFFTLILLLIATPAAAQVAINPPPPKRFVCLDKSDAYKLALADIDGTLDAAFVAKFTEDGRCAWLPAAYLFTLDSYLDSDGKPTRVVEMMAYGRTVWGLLGSLPDGTWLISN